MRSLSSGSADTIVYPAAPKLRFYGYTAQETQGAPAQFIIRHGGVALITVNLAPHESRNEWPEEGGQATPNGLTVDRVSGDTEVAVYFRNP